jgi:hypothetical protein
LVLACAVIPFLAAGCALYQFPIQPGDVLFQDDFDRPDSGWDRYHDATYSADYVNGAYRVHILTPDTDAWANPRLRFGDVRIEVDATKWGGPDDNIFGVLCRYQDVRNFYYFLVSSDGYAGIGAYKEGRRKLLTGESLLPSPAVAQGDTGNHLRADCLGFKLDFYVNGFLVAQAQAAEWMEGDVGLLAGTYTEPGTEILFDNFSVRQP